MNLNKIAAGINAVSVVGGIAALVGVAILKKKVPNLVLPRNSPAQEVVSWGLSVPLWMMSYKVAPKMTYVGIISSVIARGYLETLYKK